MNRHRLLGLGLLAFCMSFGGLATRASAQRSPVQAVRTLVIKNNQVLIDGIEVDRSDLPKSIALDSISVSYSFIGIDEPVVNLKNHFFAVRPNRLELIPGKFDLKDAQLKGKKVQQAALSDAKGWIVDSENGEYYSFQGERLEADEAVSKLLNEANNLYLSGLQYRNQSLFSRLSKERELENEAARLAGRVRAATNVVERETNTKLLTAKLTEIFEFKQENRRAEMAQFERELARLRERLERREAEKERLIQLRLDLLTKDDTINQP